MVSEDSLIILSHTVISAIFDNKDSISCLVDRIDLFLNTKEDIVKKFSKYNIPLVVDLINDDYITIDKI